VRWIETQDVIFDASMNMERLIEIGPSPTLAGMATRTLKTKYEGYDQALGMQRQVLAYSKEGKEIYYNVDPVETAEEAAPAPAAASTPAPAAAAAPAPVAAPAAAPTGPAAQIDDVPVKATEIVHTVVAQKLKKSVDDVPVQKAIKDLVGGKSTLQVLSPVISFTNGFLERNSGRLAKGIRIPAGRFPRKRPHRRTRRDNPALLLGQSR
jgi:fatty acid synthase subunit alpha, fungi type